MIEIDAKLIYNAYDMANGTILNKAFTEIEKSGKKVTSISVPSKVYERMTFIAWRDLTSFSREDGVLKIEIWGAEVKDIGDSDTIIIK